ncbi:MAG: NAD-dependent epimerase/dehydratase family protein [Candidatus Competibacteraceae bacterium]|nr:NAD-dependent epimerase/dehydratase family protein [Candidatus Competibacteraceae bacterium]MBK7983769.1 NAD-dependent epimerase/dehydratase family protein [Candidatus Competibacteraceae bacterium]MBK8897688.1 NAD-dependent epimerase/dehydratase family protein [Candidatus Competibacteraceae bacterium]MBK8961493.1 NAD-dependent epimerase/dehydratase family protein [Candidatus Competibacteraceae bacterium]MBK9950722.1 NAD-dependent epimerase/dehydratase family protein [Candidatus Competibacter
MAVVVAADFFRERPVLVTGGTGFIGRRLVVLLRARGARVRVLIRSERNLPADWHGIETVPGDLTDTDSLRRACSGIDTVVHAAGFAHADSADTPDFAARHRAVNAEGTFRLLDAALAAGVARFVFLSSVKAVGEPGAHCVDESWDTPADTPYGQAKRAAEEQVTAAGRDRGLHAVNLRPALVYGPGMKANLARLIETARRGWLPPLPDTGNRRSLVHADDVAQAALLCAANPAAAGKTYFVTDGVPYSGRELSLILRRALGRPIARWTVPAGVLYGAAAGMDGLRWVLGRRERKARTALDKLLGWACYDSTRLSAELGYRPVWTLERYCREAALQGSLK